MREYNEYRPHEGLGMLTPSDLFVGSPRKYPEKIEAYVYPSDMIVRMVSKSGAIRWRKKSWVSAGRALVHKTVGMKELGGGLWRLYFREIELGLFDENSGKVCDIMKPSEWPKIVH